MPVCLFQAQDAAAIEQLENFSTELFQRRGRQSLPPCSREAYKSAEKPDIRLLLAELNGDEKARCGRAAAALAEDITSPLESAADCINSIFTINTVSAYVSLQYFPEAEADKAKRAELFCANR